MPSEGFLRKRHIITGAEQTQKYLPYLRNRNVALVVNQTSLVENTHLVDTLLYLHIQIKKIIAPEHGFRGDRDAGEPVKDTRDVRTGLSVISLYGDNKKPTPEQLAGIDVVVFDIQDVGARFYTYLSTLHYVMEACAENGIELIVLDRPNPNGFYIDGPVLKEEFTSFVGLHPVPMVYAMTIGEYAQMINGEGWLKDGIGCRLRVIKLRNYDHNRLYNLPVKPSPNLPNMQSAYLYPSLCLFEGTVISVARGTEFPFQAIGHPELKNDFAFIPLSIPGMSKKPPYEGKECFGVDLRNFDVSYFQREKKLYLKWLINFYNQYPQKGEFFNPFFDKLAGTSELRKQIIEGKTEDEIRISWQKDLRKFREIRKKYLLYRE